MSKTILAEIYGVSRGFVLGTSTYVVVGMLHKNNVGWIIVVLWILFLLIVGLWIGDDADV